MKNDVKLSVIIPMYNVQNYVKECLDSLVNQTFKDMEIIVVDDGSTDDSVKIVSEYEKKYPFVKMVHKANGGLSDARNFGLQYAKGKYLAFIDSDDYVDHHLYELMVNEMDKGYDIVVCDIQYFFEDNTGFVMKGLDQRNIDNISKKALLSPMFAWNKIYLRSYFDGYLYPLNTWYEDTPVTTLLFAKTSKIGYVDKPLIYYRQRKDSIMGSNNSIRIKEIFNVMTMVRNNFKKEGLWDKYYDEIEYLHIEHLRLYGMFRFIRSPYFKECYLESDKVMKENFPEWKKNKYIKDLNIKNRLFLQYYNLYTKKIFDLLIKK